MPIRWFGIRDLLWLAMGLLLSAALLLIADREATRQERLRLDAVRVQAADLARISEAIIDGELLALDNALLVLRAAYSADPQRFAETIRLLRSGPLADRNLLVVLVDRDGYLEYTDAPNAKPRTYLGDRRYFRFFADGGKDSFYVDEPSLGRVTGRYTLPLIRPRYDARGAFAGVIAISIPQPTLLSFITHLQLSGETTINVVNESGALVNRSGEPVTKPGTMLPQDLLAPMLQGSEGVFASRATAGHAERIIAFRHIHHARTPLIVFVESLPGTVLRESSLQRTMMMVGAGFTSLVIMALMAVYLRGRRTTAELIETLRSSKKQEYEALTRTTLDGFLIIDGTGRIQDVNDALCALTGYPREEMLRLNLNDIEAAESPAMIAAHMHSIMAAGSDRFVSRWRRKDGRIMDVEFSVQYVKESGGRFFTFARDLTERIRADEALRESKAIFEQFMEHSPIYVFFKDENIRALRLSRNYEVLLGKPLSEALGKSMDELFPSELSRSMVADDLRVMEEGRAITVDEEFGGRSYTTIKFPIMVAGKARYLAGYTIDITERKRAESERDRLAAAIEQSGEAVVISDFEGVIRYVNPAFERLTGYGCAEILGRNALVLCSEEQDDAFYRKLRETVTAGAVWEGRVVNRKKDGSQFTVDVTISPVCDAARRIVNYSAVAHDVTEHLRAAAEKTGLEAQLRQSQKVEAIGRLAGGVAHDFNNLTAIILGYGEMLQQQLPPEGPLRRYAEQIVAAGRRSATLTRQLLAFSRKQTLQPQVLDLNALIRNLEQMLGRLIGEDIELKLRLAADPGRITADPGQIEQVITNLALNARDAMPLGGELTIETGEVELDEMFASSHESVIPGPYVMLALTDTGCGMDRATMARLFEPFFTTKPKGKGTGLGLATVYGIVKQSGGYIWAYSEPDRGTSFKIYLPRTEAEAELKAAGGGEDAPRGGGELILLVEDEQPLRELCETVLVRLGYRVRTAGSGFEALALAKERDFKPDLIVTDVIMPGMSGAELAQRLRGERPGIKVLYMSGYPDDAIAPHGILDSGTPFIQKPFTEPALALKVREALGGGPPAARPGRSVLMIDDDEQFRELAQRFCEKSGCRFAGVDSAAAALEALAGQSFDVLLVDMNLPGTDGGQVLREIRAAGHAAPAIVLTGDATSADLAVLQPLGVVRILEKSGRAEPLLQAIEAAIASRAAAD